MTYAGWRVAAMAAAVVVIGNGAATETRAQYSRRTPIVEAVQKTRAGIVTIKVEKQGVATRKRESFGTGVIVDDRGYVVTNQHVVASATAVAVHLADGTQLPAKILTEDPSIDLAILRVQVDSKTGVLPPLVALPLGPGSDLLVGETVIAVGSPYGYTHTVSTGIISAVGREINMPNGEVLSDLIQTNASINPGNSGGPLLNINGEVIGINVALREGAQGIAFAINADAVKRALSRHLSALRVAGILHGLTCSERVAAEGAQRQRVLVAGVEDHTPAAAAGLKPGDEILRVADRAVSNRFDLERALWDRKPGEQVKLAVVRAGTELTLALTLASGSPRERVASSQGKTLATPTSALRPAAADAPRSQR